MMVLLLEGSFRSDRSSTLPKENNRFDYFYLSLVFLTNWSMVIICKVRANYAEVGSATDPQCI
jgi:hypothetical protein